MKRFYEKGFQDAAAIASFLEDTSCIREGEHHRKTEENALESFIYTGQELFPSAAGVADIVENQ